MVKVKTIRKCNLWSSVVFSLFFIPVQIVLMYLAIQNKSIYIEPDFAVNVFVIGSFITSIGFVLIPYALYNRYSKLLNQLNDIDSSTDPEAK